MSPKFIDSRRLQYWKSFLIRPLLADVTRGGLVHIHHPVPKPLHYCITSLLAPPLATRPHPFWVTRTICDILFLSYDAQRLA